MSDPISTKLIFSDGNYDDKQMRSAWECEESICTEDVLRFGTCEANGFKVSLINDGTSLVGKSFDLQVTIGDSLVPTSYGTYKVQDEKFSKKQHDIMAYDLMYEIINANVSDWYNGLTFPITLQNMRDSFLALFGLSTASNLANNFSISKTITPTDLSGRRVLSSICELNGCWPNISRTGAYEEIKTGTAHTITKYIDEENAYFQTDLINKLQLRATADDIGVIYGSGDNCYIVEDNFLLYGKTSEELTAIATTMYSLISSFRYTPATLTCDGDTSIKVGDKLNVTTKEGATYSTIALYRLTKGKKRLKDTYTANGEKKQREQVNSTHSDILQLKGQTNELSRDINATKSTITTIEGDISNLQTAQSTLTQTSNELIASVSTLEKRIDQEVETYEVDYEPTLYNYPAMDWCTSFPVDGTIPIADDTVAWTYSDDDYKMHIGTLVFGKETGTMYRFTKNENGNYYWKPSVNSDYSYVMEKISELRIDVDDISIEVAETYERHDDALDEYSHLNSKIETTKDSITQTVSEVYQTKNAMTNYDTSEEVTSKITQKAGEISTSVSQIYQTKQGMNNYSTTTQVESKISQSANAITTSVSETYQTKQGMNGYATKEYTNSQIKQSAELISSEVRAQVQAVSMYDNVFEGTQLWDERVWGSKNGATINGEVLTCNNTGNTFPTTKWFSVQSGVKYYVSVDRMVDSISITDPRPAFRVNLSNDAGTQTTTEYASGVRYLSGVWARDDIWYGLTIPAGYTRMNVELLGYSGHHYRLLYVTTNDSTPYVWKPSPADSPAQIQNMYSIINQTATEVTSKVSKDGVISSINQTAESIKIKAGVIDLDGLVTATEFTTKFATIERVSASEANISTLNTGVVSIATSLNAVEATVSTINSNYVSTTYLQANYITADTINASYVKTDNLMVSGKIKANLIDINAVIANQIIGSREAPQQGTMYMGNIYFANLWVWDEGRHQYRKVTGL